MSSTNAIPPHLRVESNDNTSGSIDKSSALILMDQDDTQLLGESMGYQMATMTVGHGRQPFTIHKNLICAAGKNLREMFSGRKKDEVIHFPSETPAVFNLFIDYLYKQKVPAVNEKGSPAVQALRLRELCQLYVFAEKFELAPQICNKIMDNIQDGFRTVAKFPEADLTRAIYKNTQPNSMLRKFCSFSLLFTLRREGYVDDFSLPIWLKSNDDGLDDFLSAVQAFVPGQDPRVRDCKGSAGCLECFVNKGRATDITGVWPCVFHLHPSEATIKKKDGSSVEPTVDDQGGSSAEGGEVCHLWAK